MANAPFGRIIPSARSRAVPSLAAQMSRFGMLNFLCFIQSFDYSFVDVASGTRIVEDGTDESR
jgi:hypothetical protein